MRHLTLRPSSDLVNHIELRATDLHAGIEHPVGRPDEWLFEIDRIVDDRYDSENVAVPDEALGHRRLVAVRDTVALQPAGFQVGGEYRERVTIPPCRREAGPRVCGMSGWMRSAIKPQHARRLPECTEQLVPDRLLRNRI